MINYDLYLDETGEFKDNTLKKGFNPSAVGGLLCRADVITEKKLTAMVKEDFIHGCEQYDKDAFLGYLQEMKRMGGQFVLFENKERIFVLDADVTYLNIITEGLVQLFTELRLMEPEEDIHIRVVVAKRIDTATKDKTDGAVINWIENEAYHARLEERLIIAMGKAQLDRVSYTLQFENARQFKPLMMADIICNTFLKRNAPVAFTKEERALISSLYDERYVYSVFQNATVGAIRRLIAERRYTEAVYQLCTVTAPTKPVNQLITLMLERIRMMWPGEQLHLFTALSGQIGLYNSRSLFKAGIAFAENYIKTFLRAATGKGFNPAMINYWIFDAEFYILTMYEHLGDTVKCGEYLAACNQDLKHVSYSIENMDYRFTFRIREMNILIGRFDFEGVLKKCREMESMLSSVKDLMTLVEENEQSDEPITSGHLAKVWGVMTQTYTNLAVRDAAYAQEALAVSEKSMAEFTMGYDKARQYQLRCSLYVTVGEAAKAYDCLAASCGADQQQADINEHMVTAIFRRNGRTDLYTLYHYTNVMVLMAKKKDDRAAAMYQALMEDHDYRELIAEGADASREYPMNVIWWNLSCYLRYSGTPSSVGEGDLFTRGYGMTLQNADKITYGTFAIAMTAERLLWMREAKQKTADAEKMFNKAAAVLSKPGVPETMKAWWGELTEAKAMTNDRLKELSTLYVK